MSEKQSWFDFNICRFCGSTGKKLCDFQSGKLSSGSVIWQLIRRLVPLKIEPQDQKPQQVCYECLSTLEKYDAFIATCLVNDLTFDNMLQNMKSSEPSHGNENLRSFAWPQTGDLKFHNDQNSEIVLFNKLNEPVNVQNENFCILVDLNCKVLNIEPAVLKCNENNNNILPVGTEWNENSKLHDLKKIANSDLQILNTTKKIESKIKPFKCSICSKSLTRKSNLVSHLALHSQDRPHKCNECGKKFAIYSDLALHKHIHTQSYSCKICQKCFVTKSKLERHGRSHTGVKEHGCPICKKRFSEKNNMIAHMSVHTGERPFSCSICKKSFRTQSHLTDHGKVHSAESPFKCTVCSKSFKWKSNLRDHCKFHSGEKFRCTDCDKEFNIRTDYYKHRKECREEKLQLREKPEVI